MNVCFISNDFRDSLNLMCNIITVSAVYFPFCHCNCYAVDYCVDCNTVKVVKNVAHIHKCQLYMQICL